MVIAKSRQQIIESLWRNKRIIRSISIAANGKNTEFEEELRSCVFASLCEMSEEKILRLHEEKGLVSYLLSKIKNQIRDTGGGANRNINYVPNRNSNDMSVSGVDFYTPDLLVDENSHRHTDTIDIANAIESLNWFEKEVINLYIKYGSLNKISQYTSAGIPYISGVLDSARKKIKDFIK